MYAIINIAGKQFKITENEKISVPRLSGEVGDKIEFDQVLLVSTDKGVKIGQPLVKTAKVKASVVSHDRAKKIIVFKKKRRKDYKITRGHRQQYTKIQIEKINA